MVLLSILIVAGSIALALDLFFAYVNRTPVQKRHALGTLALVILITARICQRLYEGSF